MTLRAEVAAAERQERIDELLETVARQNRKITERRAS